MAMCCCEVGLILEFRLDLRQEACKHMAVKVQPSSLQVSFHFREILQRGLGIVLFVYMSVCVKSEDTRCLSVCLITVVSSDGVGIHFKKQYLTEIFSHIRFFCQSIYFLAVYNFQLLHQSSTY